METTGINTITPRPAPIDDNALLVEAKMIADEIVERLDAERHDNKAPRDRRDVNYASELGHPCAKKLVHARLDWDKKQPIDLDGMYRIEEGIRADRMIQQDLAEVGFSLSQSQVAFSIPELKIRGRIDGMMPLSRIALSKMPRKIQGVADVPAEVKTIGPMYWDSTRTIEDIRRHRAWWIRGYPSQLNAYLYASNSPFGFFVLKTFGKRPRILPMLLDYELMDADMMKIRKVNAHVDAGTYPEPIPYDPQICGMCDFAHLCQPLVATELVEVDASQEVILEQYLELKAQKERFDAMHELLVGTGKKPGRFHGKNAIIGSIAISTTVQERTQYDVPKDVKEPYARKQEVVITKIERLG